MEFNGESTKFFVSIKEALISDEWDFVTIQQASHLSIKYDTYQPYGNYISEYIRTYCPKAKLYIHQTWAYEQDSHRLNIELGYNNHVYV